MWFDFFVFRVPLETPQKFNAFLQSLAWMSQLSRDYIITDLFLNKNDFLHNFLFWDIFHSLILEICIISYGEVLVLQESSTYDISYII